ncbi:MAG: DUF2993 domain-containing protein [Prochloron sp. SP5CPC1]|nr:DUF2993 domain-containing protein [Candidatus Paraprochloron terpiosi SP5CPC1]
MNKQSKIISKILSPALRLWLRTQVETIEGLELKITGGDPAGTPDLRYRADRQILGGYIPQVALSCNTAVYEGIHVGAVQLEAENIRINIGQVMRGKPLGLLEPVTVRGKLEVDEAALNASLQSPLLSGGLTDLLAMLLAAGGTNSENLLSAYHISWCSITLKEDKFTLTGTLRGKGGETTPVTIRSGLSLVRVGGHHLRFHPIHIDGILELGTFPDSLEIDLGEQVEIEDLSIAPGYLSCAAIVVIISD